MPGPRISWIFSFEEFIQLYDSKGYLKTQHYQIENELKETDIQDGMIKGILCVMNDSIVMNKVKGK